ncbi:MAG TPA: hypothetical protein DDW50_08975 [Firmicutes bacterium]|jgi:hypothetical protein|nr:hypothetical protein [Bacillota bacterium]
MRKIFVCTFIIFIYNILLLILPVLIFLALVQWSTPSSIHFLPWIYCPFLLISPILSIVLGVMMIKGRINLFNALLPIITILIGYLPFYGLYRYINSVWIPTDYLFLLGLPILFGLIADSLAISMPVLEEWFSHFKLR